MRSTEGFMITIACIMIAYFSLKYLYAAHVRTKTVLYWIKVTQIVVVAFIGAFYFVSAVGMSASLFGSSSVAMAWYRPINLILLVTLLIDVIYRYRSQI